MSLGNPGMEGFLCFFQGRVWGGPGGSLHPVRHRSKWYSYGVSLENQAFQVTLWGWPGRRVVVRTPRQWLRGLSHQWLKARKNILPRMLDWVPPLGPLPPCARACVEWLQLCLTLCDPVDCSLPGSSVHGFSRKEHWSGLPDPGTEPVALTPPALVGRFFTTSTTWEAQSLHNAMWFWNSEETSEKFSRIILS